MEGRLCYGATDCRVAFDLVTLDWSLLLRSVEIIEAIIVQIYRKLAYAVCIRIDKRFILISSHSDQIYT